MKNKTLAITRSCIPYFKELRTLAGSVTASILMQQLDYWFEKQNGEPFYKFKAPCNNKYYKNGGSFIEELGFSLEEFTTAFLKIGIAYKSKTEFENEADKFKEMFYCSYFDRKEGVTFYCRNHQLLDIKLNELFTVNRESQFTETDKANLQKPTKPISPIYITEEYNNKLQQNNNKKNNKKENVADDDSYLEQLFLRFYQSYQKKGDSNQAKKTFFKLCRESKNIDILIESILSSYEVYRQVAGSNLQYWKNASTFLNNHQDYTQDYLDNFRKSNQGNKYGKSNIAKNDEQRRIIDEGAKAFDDMWGGIVF